MPLPTIPSGNVASATASTTYDVDNSCRFNDGDSPSMTKTMVAGSTDFAKKFTISAWIKLGATGTRRIICSFGSGTTDAIDFEINSSNQPSFESWDGSVNPKITSTRFLRDHSAWYHMYIAVDTTQATDTNRMKMYINGVQETAFTSSVYPAEDYLFPGIGTTNDTMKIGNGAQYTSNYFDGYMAEFCYCDAQIIAVTDFGEFDSDSPTIWKPKDVSGLIFGNAGTYCDFQDSDNLGDDESGNTNDLTENNIAAADQATDTPTNNFCTGNPMIHGSKLPTLSEGNCLFVSASDWDHVPSTMGVANGKWYAEFKCVAKTGGQMMGVIDSGHIAGWGASPPLYVGNAALGHCYQDNGNKQTGDSATSYGATYTAGDIIGAALNADDGEITFYKNNAVQDSGTAITLPTSTSSDGIWFFLPSLEVGTIAANYGGCSAFTLSSAAQDENGYGNFEYAPPSGYLALCTKNLATDG